MSDDIPDLPVERPRKEAGGLLGASIVWMVPVAALVVALTVGISNYIDRGPIIRISFEDASGILPKETELRFRNVAVGVVEKVEFNADLTRVLVDVRVDTSVAEYVDAGAEFWVVQPEVTTSGVSGLQTVLTGVYIAGNWDARPEGNHANFIGREEPPLSTAYRTGIEIELRSARANGIPENTPILFRGIEVGRVGNARISRNGQAVIANAIIFDAHTRLVSTATRFWDTSGVRFSIGPNGAQLDFSSLASLVAGGITFDTLVSGGQPLEPGFVYDVFPDQATARSSVFEDNDGEVVTLTLVFEENVSGLAPESVVEWRGVRIGQVVTVTGLVDVERFGDERVRLLATIDIRPQRFGLGRGLTQTSALDFLEQRVGDGLRARLASASLLTGGLKVELVTVEDPLPAAFEREAEPFPIFPVTDSQINDVTATAEGVLQRLTALPVEELMQSTIAFLDNATALVASEALQSTPAEVLGLLADARGVIGSDAVQALPADIRALLGELQGAGTDLRAILQDIREAGAVERLLAAVGQVGAAAEAANAAVVALPDLIARVTGLVEQAAEIPLNTLTEQAIGLATEARAFVASDAVKALPATITSSVSELGTLLTAFNEAETPDAVAAAIAEIDALATTLQAAFSGVPAIVTRLDRIAANAEEVGLADLATELQAVLASASQLFGQAGEAALPEALATALAEAEAALAELRQGGLITSANDAIGSARAAAAAVEAAAGRLPELLTRLNSAVGTAQSTFADYDGDSPLGRQTNAALREIERAAKAVADLARTIERRPNSIIIGR